MHIITGLGNPGSEYSGTRHNIGFDVVEALAKKHKIRIRHLRHRSLIGRGHIHGHKIFLVKPLTYMNRSGESVRRAISYYRRDEKKDLIVIADDINLAPGRLRIRRQGSDGGHKGLKSIIEQLGHQDFIRMRIGVGAAAPGHDLVGHVLGHFAADEAKAIRESIDRAVCAIECIIENGVDIAMSKYNGEPQ